MDKLGSLIRQSRNVLVHRLVFVMLVAGCGTAIAGYVGRHGVSDAELRMLPPYCPDTMGFTIYGDSSSNTSPRAKYWVSLMGQSFWHMHHYCAAELSMMRAQRAKLSQQQRQDLLDEALANYQYVIDNAESGYVLLPEVYTRLGKTALQRGLPDRANAAFARAREIKPDYWPAYSNWAEFLMKIGRRPEALSIVTAGLKQTPEAKVLLEQYRLLGGKPSGLPAPGDAQPASALPGEASTSAPQTSPPSGADPDER